MSAYLCLAIAVLAWGIEYPFLRYSTTSIGFLATGAVMFSIAAALLGLTFLIRGRKARVGDATEQRRFPYGSLILIGAISVGVNVLGLLATKLTSTVNVSTLARSDVLFSLLLSALVFREAMDWKTFLFLPFMLLGICLLTGILVNAPELGRTGDFVILGSAFFVGLNAFVIKRTVQNISGLMVGFWNSATNGLTFFTAALVSKGWSESFGRIPPRIWVVLAVLGVLAFAFFASYNAALRALPVWEVRLFCLLIPVVAMVTGWMALKERPTGWQVLGMGLVSGGAAGIVALRRPRMTGGNALLRPER